MKAASSSFPKVLLAWERVKEAWIYRVKLGFLL